MNKRFLSTLLFGALFFASTSVFVSCKDYDDDIKNLQTQIDKAALKSDLDALQTTLTNASTNAEAAMKNLEAKLEAKLAEQAQQNQVNADELQKQIDAVKAAADAAAKDLAAKIKEAADAAAAAAQAAAEAQSAADSNAKAAAEAAEAARLAQEAANAALQEAIDKLNAENAELRMLISSLGKTTMSKEAADELKAQIEELKNQIAHMDGASEVTAAYRAAVDELYSAVTSIDLIESYTGYKYMGDGNSWSRTNGWYLNSYYSSYGDDVRHHLALTHGFVPETSVFGDNELLYNPAENAYPQVTYTEGADIKIPAGIVVRVNPVNADISKGDVSIKLIDSQGYDMDGIIEVGTPVKYNGVITRGKLDNAGLWIIPVSVAKGVTEEQFNYWNNIQSYGSIYNENIKYAVAINNTATTEKDRYVTSTFDLSFTYSDYVPANHFTFKVATHEGVKQVEGIHNRWDGVRILGEETPNSKYDNPELEWAPSTKDAPAPTAVPVWDDKAKNHNVAVQDTWGGNWGFNDIRRSYPCMVVDVNETFAIGAFEAYTEAGIQVAIDSIYVVLDKHNAVESKPSEINAWESYTYEGLNTVVTADKGLTLKITSPQADGDVIGFRVYAVNSDGSLVDPDGRAFYVLVTHEPVDNTLESVVVAKHDDGSDKSTVMGIEGLINGDLRYYIDIDPNENPFVVDNTGNLAWAVLDYFQFNFFDTETKTEDSFWTGTGNYNKFYPGGGYLNPAYDVLTITPKNVQNLVDNATYTFRLVEEEYVQRTWVARKITYIKLTKIMPDEAQQLEFRPKQEGQWKNGEAKLNNWEQKDNTGVFMAFMVPNKEGAVLYGWSAPWATTFAVHQTDAEQVASYEALPNKAKDGFKNLSNVFYNLSAKGQNGHLTGAYDESEWDKNYEFLFKNALYDAANDKVVDLAKAKGGKLGKGSGILYEDPGYAGFGDYRSENYKYMLDVTPNFIDGLTEHEVATYYVYKNVSTTLKADGTVNEFAANWRVANGQNLKAIFACWHHANTFDWDGGSSKCPQLQWTHDGNTTNSEFKKITNKNWYDPAFFGNGTAKAGDKTFETLFANGWLDFGSATIELNTKADGTGQVNPYFVPTFDLANKKFTFNQKATQIDAAPIADHDEYLRVKVKDVFDHDVWVVLVVKILKPKA